MIKKNSKTRVEKPENKDKKNDKKDSLDSYKKKYYIKEKDADIKQIIEVQLETLENYAKICLQVIQPEEYNSLIECNVFSESEKNELNKTHKRVMIAHRTALIALIQNNKESEDLMKEIDKEIDELKPQIIRIIIKFRESWKKEMVNGKAGYFG